MCTLPDAELILRLTTVLEQISVMQAAADLELRCFTPGEAAAILGKTEYWIRDACRDGRIPHTYVGKSPRLTAAHIRWVQAQGERVPNQYARPLSG
ncbi:helix-turn-helix domain-containing protein [Streptomyces lincolnensis]|uniref:helix-turn-helix domain-containing protein n=1 Tax=Streptomyces lincolnensis TaxID=1915 RepID=UPI0037D92EF5